VGVSVLITNGKITCMQKKKKKLKIKKLKKFKLLPGLASIRFEVRMD
jgi:hypothetical protein